MSKRKVFIAIHQLNIGGAQKALISALNAIDYEANDVTLYVRKDRLDLLPSVNENVSEIIINKDHTKYYRKPYTAFMTGVVFLKKLLKIDTEKTEDKIRDYIVKSQIKYEKKQYFSDGKVYDVAVSYIQGYTALSVAQNIKAKKKVLFYHDSTDSLHKLHDEVFKEYDEIYCVSDGAKKALCGFYPQHTNKIDYIENFVDYKKIRKEADVFVPEYSADKVTLCTCGRMTKVKGYDLAVKAAKILKDSGLSFEWYFVGDGVERANIEKLIEENKLADDIVITGIVDNPYAYIKNCDIYIQPSYEESYGLAIIEAMILCRPIVSTKTVGAKVVLSDENTGMIAEIDEKSLADKIMHLLNYEELQIKIKQNLNNKDYEEDYRIFCKRWKKLLED